MSSLNFKFVAVALTYALLASAAVPYRRSTYWLQKNGPAAKSLNDQFKTLSPDTPCNDDGHIACINNQFATCYEGSYRLAACHSGWSCAAVPNEWDEGTTTTCDTDDNIAWRFAQAGISEYKRDTHWLQQNGPAAKILNDQYRSLTPGESCGSEGNIACVGGVYAVCYDGSWKQTGCWGDTTCAAVPNERSQGTTTLCDTPDNIAYRFSQAGISEY